MGVCASEIEREKDREREGKGAKIGEMVDARKGKGATY